MSRAWLIVLPLLAVLALLLWQIGPPDGVLLTRVTDDASAASATDGADAAVSYSEATAANKKAKLPRHAPEWWRRIVGSMDGNGITLAEAERFLAEHGRTPENFRGRGSGTPELPCLSASCPGLPDALG